MLVFRLLQTSFGSSLNFIQLLHDWEVAGALEPEAALPLVQTALLEPTNVDVLRAQASEWTQPYLVTEWDNHEVERRFMDGVGRGEIRIVHETPPEWVPPPPTPVTALDRGLKLKPQPQKKKKAFFALELVDQDGDPIPNERFKIELPDGSFREGTTDDKGKARIDGIDPPGSCKVSFPDLDAADWKAA